MELLRDKDLKWLKKAGDEAWNWEEIIKGIPGKVAELGDGPAIGLFTNQLNRWLSPQIDDEIKQELHDVFDKVIEGDYKAALVELSDVAVVIVDNVNVSEKIKPWLFIAIEMYKGIIKQLSE